MVTAHIRACGLRQVSPLLANGSAIEICSKGEPQMIYLAENSDFLFSYQHSISILLTLIFFFY